MDTEFLQLSPGEAKKKKKKGLLFGSRHLYMVYLVGPSFPKTLFLNKQ